MFWPHFLLFTAWLAYGFIHSALATSPVQNFANTNLKIGSKSYRIFYNLIAILLLIPLIYYCYFLNSYFVFTKRFYTHYIGIFLTFTGFTIMVICILGYFKQMSGVNNLKPVLLNKGLHKYVRHPLYTGTFIFITGLFFLRPLYSTLVSVLPIMLYTFRALQWEEQKLILKFGSAYSEYQKTTTALLPSLRHTKKIKGI